MAESKPIHAHAAPQVAERCIDEDGIVFYRIPLSAGKVALVDECDLEVVQKFKWCATKVGRHNKWYAMHTLPDAGNGKRKTLFMHRAIINAPPHLQVDHRDNDGLNNRRKNIRLASTAQNHANRRIVKKANATSPFKGVSYSKLRRKWYAKIKSDGKAEHLASCDSALQAALIYDDEARLRFGEFAAVNFPERCIGAPPFATCPKKMSRSEIGRLGAAKKWEGWHERQ